VSAVDLSTLTTLRLGGPARDLVVVRREDELVAAVRDLDARGTPVLVLGGGSNVVIADAGFDGTVVHVQTRGIARAGATLTVQAGEPWDPLVHHTIDEGLTGIECLSGIPGSTGATPIQNVGAYGQDVAQAIDLVRVLDRSSGRVVELTAAQCGFRYRSSALKGRDDRIVLAVRFRLRSSTMSEKVAYRELARTLGIEVGDVAPLAEVRDAVIGLRRAKGMVIDPADPDSVSAGSFFTNPILEGDAFSALVARAADRGLPAPPGFPEPDGRTKTSAAWLIERAGFAPGFGDGPVGISSKHTLALVNRGGATTAALVALAREVAAGVHDAFGVDLHPEPVFVGHEW
jgi:UDP-N-acetylmuramate dehydrogenase